MWDITAFYFSDKKIREAALKNKEAVLDAFKNLCEENEEFRNSIETTTKSLDSTRNRFYLWGVKLRETLGLDFEVLDLADGRIKFPGFWR